MNDEAVKLLMMFINDAYNGKCPTKKTALSMMHFVAKYNELQRMVNASDSNAILSYKFEDNKK